MIARRRKISVSSEHDYNAVLRNKDLLDSDNARIVVVVHLHPNYHQ